MKGSKVKIETLIRASSRDIFEAFTKPRILKKFWLNEASAPLQAGKKATWEFMVPGVRDEVSVIRFEPHKFLALRWSDGSETEWTIDSWKDGYCRVTVEHGPFEGENAWEMAMNNVEGYSAVLADLKVLLETGTSPAIVRDMARLITDQMSKSV